RLKATGVPRVPRTVRAVDAGSIRTHMGTGVPGSLRREPGFPEPSFFVPARALPVVFEGERTGVPNLSRTAGNPSSQAPDEAPSRPTPVPGHSGCNAGPRW